MKNNLESLDKAGNVQFNEEHGYCSIQLKPNIYSLDAVKLAAHHMSAEINIIIGGDSGESISIEMFLKDKSQSIRDMFWKLNESLLSYSTYLIQSDRNQELREAILKKALSVLCRDEFSKDEIE